MSIDAVSATSTTQLQAVQSDQTSLFKQRRQDFNTLSQALSSGDLAAAQNAFSAFQQDQTNIQQLRAANRAAQGGSQPVQSGMNDAMNALASALASGDLPSAQNAFASLQQDMQNALQAHSGHGHHSHHHHHASSAQAGAVASTTGVAPATTSINTTA